MTKSSSVIIQLSEISPPPPQKSVTSLATGAKKGQNTTSALIQAPMDPSHKKCPTNSFSATFSFKCKFLGQDHRNIFNCLHCAIITKQFCDGTMSSFKYTPSYLFLYINLKWNLESDKNIS